MRLKGFIIIIFMLTFLLVLCNKKVQKLSYYIYSQNKEIVVTYEGDQADPQHIMLSGFAYCDEEYLDEKVYTVIYYFDGVKYIASIARSDYINAKDSKKVLQYVTIVK